MSIVINILFFWFFANLIWKIFFPTDSSPAPPVSECDPGETLCSSVCVNLETDPANCGECGRAIVNETKFCSNGMSANCSAGMRRCSQSIICSTNVTNDDRNCSSCGNDCQGGTCIDSTCVPNDGGGGGGE